MNRTQRRAKEKEEGKKHLERKINITVVNPDKSETVETYTTEELAQQFVHTRNSNNALSAFTKVMAVEFYKAAPDNEFFIKCDANFMGFVKSQIAKEAIKSEDSVPHLKLAEETSSTTEESF